MENKIDITALGPMAPMTEETIKIGEADVIVKNKIPYEQVLDMILFGTNLIIGERNYISGPVYNLISDLLLVHFYTNIQIEMFSDPTAEIDPSSVYETYDILESFNAMENIKAHIDAKQLASFSSTLEKTLTSIINYKNSAQGIIDTLADDAEARNLKLKDAMDYLQNDENFKEAKKLAELAMQTEG